MTNGLQRCGVGEAFSEAVPDCGASFVLRFSLVFFDGFTYASPTIVISIPSFYFTRMKMLFLCIATDRVLPDNRHASVSAHLLGVCEASLAAL